MSDKIGEENEKLIKIINYSDHKQIIIDEWQWNHFFAKAKIIFAKLKKWHTSRSLEQKFVNSMFVNQGISIYKI